MFPPFRIPDKNVDEQFQFINKSVRTLSPNYLFTQQIKCNGLPVMISDINE